MPVSRRAAAVRSGAKAKPKRARGKAPGATGARRTPKPTPGYGDTGKTSTTTSTFSPRLLALKQSLEDQLRQLFPAVEPVFAYGLHGWRMKRLRPVAWTVGTIDPAYVHVFVAERAQGITLHVWSPFDPALLQRHREALGGAGFKVMVGCLQFNRKADYPLQAVRPLLEETAAALRSEAHNGRL